MAFFSTSVGVLITFLSSSVAVPELQVFTSNSMNSLADHMKTKYVNNGSPILKSLDPNINYDSIEKGSGNRVNNVPIQEQLSSLSLSDDVETEITQSYKSILLLDDRERLRIGSVESFLKLLNIPPNTKVKVISIFGNTGEGKSFSLNHLFFNGEEVFRTSSSQSSCTLGAWAKYDPKTKIICLDTEGLLVLYQYIQEREPTHPSLAQSTGRIRRDYIQDASSKTSQRHVHLLGGPSKAYKDHFSSALKKALGKSECETVLNGLGPGVIIFHETRHTDTLHHCTSVTQSVEDILHSTFSNLNLPYDAFSFIKYVGIKTKSPPTSFTELKRALLEKLESTEVRSPRDPKYVYLTLKSLNDKFQNSIGNTTPQLYLPAFFTCPDKCQSCDSGCILSMGHKDEGEPHSSDKSCKFQHQYQNYVYLCKACHKNGNKVIVKPSYQPATETSWTSYLNFVWSGYVIECPNCGEIYRSRQHWYGNKNPEDCAVRLEIVHIWPGEKDKYHFQEKPLFGSQNSAQKVLDGVTMFSDVIASVGSQPKKVISDWAADKIRPSYWRPNHEIKECYKCKAPFPPTATYHHCRACGEGFCEGCSSKRQTVPSRGWFSDVRVCDDCYREEPPSLSNAADGSENLTRVIGETVVSSISAVKCVFDIPRGFIKDTVRPSYWTPDNECTHCAVCQKQFGFNLSVHHCRDCGKGVCEECSMAKKTGTVAGLGFARQGVR
ncbi:hypothetical protein NQ317_006028 [Molorchus minor]|uniref:FYVE-type domain-containing protein n=1 Tax=Molorchus minor TaxID=1323400 RepID=A0ABQ9K3C2_9CUCU|nr:hypothetical protein NQ317_006028 [Molorchus minor]